MLAYRPNSVFPLRGRARLTWQIVRLTAPSFSTFLVLHSAVIIRIPKDSGFQYHINWSKIIKCKLIPCLWVISSSIKELWFMIPTFWGIIPSLHSPTFLSFFFPLKQFQGPLLHISQLVQRGSGRQLDEPRPERQRRLRVQGARMEVPRGEKKNGDSCKKFCITGLFLLGCLDCFEKCTS